MLMAGELCVCESTRVRESMRVRMREYERVRERESARECVSVRVQKQPCAMLMAGELIERMFESM
jgi:hypothetical protein